MSERRSPAVGGGSRAPRRRPSRASRRRRLLLFLLAATGLVVVVVVALAVLRGPGEDPFTGVYWDRDSGRRVEITHRDGGYQLLYGVARRGYPAERYGDELQVRDPFSGYVLVRSTDEGLVLVSGSRTTKLEPLTAGK